MLKAILMVCAISLPMIRAWPQVARIAIKKESKGISILSWRLMLINFTVWTVYGIVIPVAALTLTNVLAGLGAFAVLFSLEADKRKASIQLFGISMVAALCALGIHLLGGTTAVGTVATAISVCMFLPQAVKVFRDDVRGISAGTWWLAVASSVSWISYGFLIHHPGIAAPHVVMLPCSLIVLYKIYQSKVPTFATK